MFRKKGVVKLVYDIKDIGYKTVCRDGCFLRLFCVFAYGEITAKQSRVVCGAAYYVLPDIGRYGVKMKRYLAFIGFGIGKF